jgi:N utilization substance protein B
MLNRRYLRIKVYQALYAFWQAEDASAARIEKELLLSIERTFDLYVQLLLLFGEVRHAAANRIMDRKQKRLPTPGDLNPNMRFVESPLLARLSESPRLMAEAAKRKLGWMGHGELISSLYKQIEESAEYKAYMAGPPTSFAQDQAFLEKLFVDHIAQFEPLHDLSESRSIYWLEDLDLACSLVKRTLATMKAGDNDVVLSELDRDPQGDRDFVIRLFRAAVELGPANEQAIGEKAANWDTERMAVSDMILMKMALAEVKTFEDIPTKVTMNEYIEIAKAYSTPKSKAFINGILDKLFIEGVEQGAIRKVGRGLLEE